MMSFQYQHTTLIDASAKNELIHLQKKNKIKNSKKRKKVSVEFTFFLLRLSSSFI
jgi:hypothetical protein